MDLNFSIVVFEFPGICKIPIPPLEFQESIVEALSSIRIFGEPSGAKAKSGFLFAERIITSEGTGDNHSFVQSSFPCPADGAS